MAVMADGKIVVSLDEESKRLLRRIAAALEGKKYDTVADETFGVTEEEGL